MLILGTCEDELLGERAVRVYYLKTVTGFDLLAPSIPVPSFYVKLTSVGQLLHSLSHSGEDELFGGSEVGISCLNSVAWLEVVLLACLLAYQRRPRVFAIILGRLSYSVNKNHCAGGEILAGHEQVFALDRGHTYYWAHYCWHCCDVGTQLRAAKITTTYNQHFPVGQKGCCVRVA
jgi:hypothetical protein